METVVTCSIRITNVGSKKLQALDETATTTQMMDTAGTLKTIANTLVPTASFAWQ